jgi:alpha-D-ribose 1-methylphosphonate 5-triphosphate synthase subunit PhnG
MAGPEFRLDARPMAGPEGKPEGRPEAGPSAKPKSGPEAAGPFRIPSEPAAGAPGGGRDQQAGSSESSGSSLDRTRLSRAVSSADRRELFRLLENLGPLPALEYLREPQKGLIMIRARSGGTGRPFNLGEALAARCSVRLGGRIGHGLILGDDPAWALAAAVLDALNQEPAFGGAVENLVSELEKSLARKQAAEKKKALKTKVEFFTLVRGENDE